jgi:hypothetical protein
VSRIGAKSLIAASIYWSGMNMMAGSSYYVFGDREKYSENVMNNSDTLALSVDSLNRDSLNTDSLKIPWKNQKVTAEDIIASYAKEDIFFKDNNYYMSLRETDAFSELKKYGIDKESTVMVINKTFQKAMILRMEMQLYIYSRDSIDSFIRQGKDFKVSRNMPDKIVTMVLEPNILLETDCSTAMAYGSKEFDGDAKTPEGLFNIYSIEDSQNWMYDGLWAFGPKFLRIKNSIGIHGNGTDTSKTSSHRDLFSDKRFMVSGPLGIYANNFGYGLSHGCIRLENSVLDRWTNDGILKNGTKVIIFENKELTEILSKHYLSAKGVISCR